MHSKELENNIRTYLEQQVELFGDGPVHLSLGNNLTSFSLESEDWQGAADLVTFHAAIKDCQKCRLGQSRNKFVFGSGRADADIMLIGEAPGADEDAQGFPFVGQAGQLLDKILESIGFDRQEVYICNILKCRPPQNRDPEPDEIEKCLPYLQKQIRLVNPRLILCLGRIASQTLLQTDQSLSRLRSKTFRYENATLITTYHPAALLRYPQYKRDTWEDVKWLKKLYTESLK